MIIRRHLRGEAGNETGIALFHRQANPLQVSQRVLLPGTAPGGEQRIARRGQIFPGQPDVFCAAIRGSGIAGIPLRIVIVALRLRRIRRLRAKRQQPAPVFATRQLVHKAAGQCSGGRQRRIGADKLRDRQRRLIHQVVGELAILQIGVKRVVRQGGH